MGSQDRSTRRESEAKTHRTLKALPPMMQPKDDPKSKRPPLAEDVAIANFVQEEAMRVIDDAVTRYLESIAEEKRIGALGYPGIDAPDVISDAQERWCDLRVESRFKQEEHLARVIQSLRGEVGPDELNKMGFDFVPCGMRYGDHYFFSIPTDDDCCAARVLCIPANDVVDPSAEGVRI